MGKHADADLKEAVVAAIAKNLLEVGPTMWELVEDRFPDVTQRTFKRWVSQVRSGKLSPDSLKEEGRRRAAAQISAHLPAVPSPHFMVADGPSALIDMDFMSRLRLIEADLLLLRESAVYPMDHTDPAKAGKIKNAQVFLATIKGRLGSLDQGLKIVERAWDLHFMGAYLDRIVKIVTDIVQDPLERKAIGLAVQDLNNEFNMTMNARDSHG